VTVGRKDFDLTAEDLHTYHVVFGGRRGLSRSSTQKLIEVGELFETSVVNRRADSVDSVFIWGLNRPRGWTSDEECSSHQLENDILQLLFDGASLDALESWFSLASADCTRTLTFLLRR
jgi:hypothetical protein